MIRQPQKRYIEDNNIFFVTISQQITVMYDLFYNLRSTTVFFSISDFMINQTIVRSQVKSV